MADERPPADGTDRNGCGYDALSRAADDDLDASVSPWGDSHFQERYAWPGTSEELPPLDGLDVLLAGCGRGDHVPYFRERGATVTGVDASDAAVATARERHPAATFAVVDLADGLAFEDASFDLVCSNLVLSHLADWSPVLASFERVLRADGTLVVSTIHPAYQREHWDLERYDERVEETVDWGVTRLTSYYRPTSKIVQAFLDSGFALESLAEPTPTPSYEAVNPERYASALSTPQVLVVRATPGQGTE